MDAGFVAMMDSGFSYYEPLKLQSSIESQFYAEETTKNTIQEGVPFDFSFEGAEIERQYLNLAGSYFSFKVKFSKLDAEKKAQTPVADDELSCVQNLAHSLFKSIQVWLGEKQVTEPNQNYPYQAYMLDLLTRNSEEQKFWMPLQGWFKKELPGKLDGFRTKAGQNPTDHATERQGVMGTGQTVQLVMRPHVELFNAGTFIPPGLKVKVQFTPNAPEFVAKRGGTGSTLFKFEISEAKFHVHVIKATNVQHLAVVEAMRKLGPLRINMKRLNILTHLCTSGASSAPEDTFIDGPVPNRVIFGLVTDTAFKGSYTSNPFNFQNFNMNSLALSVNSKLIPAEAYAPNWEGGAYKKEYLGSLTALNKGFVPDAVNLTLEEFKEGYTLFAFDLTPDKNNPTTVSTQGKGNIHLKLKFGTALPSAVHVVALIEHDLVVEINAGKQVSVYL